MAEKINKFVEKLMFKFKKISLNSNNLKVIAIVTMLIDHIGYYFEDILSNYAYIILRVIGRIAMPLFAFLIVQGFFYTKNLKKYIIRIFSVSIITQIGIFLISLLDYNTRMLSVNNQLNILFSYTLSLILLWLIHEKNIIKRFNYNQNMFFKIFMIICIIGIFIFIPFDYGIYIPLLIVMLYFIERLKIMIYLEKQNFNISMKKIVTSFITEKNIKIGYILLIAIALLIIIIESNNRMYWYMLLSLIPIYLYNGERGAKDKKLNIMFYSVFPIQHFLLYLLSIIVK